MKGLILPLAAIICFNDVAFASEVEITVRPHNFVRGERVVLGDIADFNGFTLSEVSSLSRIALGNAPGQGEKRSYSNQALTEILRVHLKKYQAGGDRRIKLHIPNEVLVEGNGLNLSRATIEKGLIKNLQEICAKCEYKIEELRAPQLPAFSPESTWQLRADYHKLKGAFNIPLEVINPLGEKSVFWIGGRITIYKEVPVATRVLTINDRVQSGDFKWERRDITYLHDSSPDESELVGEQVRMSVGPSQIIVKSNLARRKALNRGDVVTITTGGATWSLTTKGISQDSGYIGDTVKVLNADTKKLMSGVVVSQGTVEIK